MANPRDPNELNNELTRLNRTFNETLETFDELIFASRDFSNEVAKAAKSVFDNKVQAIEQVKAFKNLANLSRDFAAEIADINDGTKSLSNLNKFLLKQEQAKNKFVVEYRQALNKIGVEQSKINEIVNDQKSIYEVLGDDIDDFTTSQSQLIEYFDQQNEILREQEKTLGQIVGRAQTIESAFGGAGKIAEGIESALNKMGLSKLTDRLGISDAIEESRKFAANLTEGQDGPANMATKIGQQFKVLGSLATNIGGNLLKSLGPVPIIIGTIVKLVQFLIGAMFESDKQATNLARSLGLSKDQAYQLRENLAAGKDSLTTQYKLTEEIIQAQIQLNELTSFQLLSSKESLDAQIQLTKEMGLTAQEAADLNKLFIVNNTEGNKGLNILYKEIANYANLNKIKINGNKVLQEASKINGQILSTFKGSTEELIKSVIQSNQLGINLEKARDISRGFLDFESSISSELEAELITGKSLNLERARLLALQGKFVEASKEATEQIGDYNYFSKLNVLQQEAIAKSINMSVDDLAETLRVQTFLGKEKQEQYKRLREAGLDEEASLLAQGKISAENVANSMKMLNAQEKFGIALSEAKEIFTDLVEGGTLDSLADILKGIAESLSFLGTSGRERKAAKIEKQFKNTDKFKNASEEQKANYEDLFKKSKDQVGIKETIGSTMKASLLGPIGLLINDARLIIKNKKSKEAYKEVQNIIDNKPAEDFIIRPGQPIQKFRKDDVVIGGTNLGGNSQETNQLLKELINIMKQGGNVYLDSNKVGTVFSTNSVRTQ